MAVVSVLAAPGDVALPGVPFEDLGPFAAWLATVPPVRRWLTDQQSVDMKITVCGEGTGIPEACLTILDVPLTDSEYARFEEQQRAIRDA